MQRRDHEHTIKPTLTLEEFERLLLIWICDVYHVSDQRGLGIIRGIGGRPLDAWAEKMPYTTAPLPPRDQFTALAGDIHHGTIQKDGVRWDHILYEGPELWALQNHPQHKRRSDGVASRYKFVRDPYDLGSIQVIDPYNKRPIRVSATAAHASYATGLTLHQHKVNMANVKARKNQIDISDLLAVKAELAHIAMSILQHPGRRKVEKSVAKYLGGDFLRRQSHISTQPKSDAGSNFLSFDQPMAIEQVAVAAVIGAGVRYEDDFDDDIEALNTRMRFRSSVDSEGAAP